MQIGANKRRFIGGVFTGHRKYNNAPTLLSNPQLLVLELLPNQIRASLSEVEHRLALWDSNFLAPRLWFPELDVKISEHGATYA